MNQLTISAANAAARVASVDRDVASSLGAAECSSLSLLLLRHLHLHSSVHQRFLSHSLSHSSSLSSFLYLHLPLSVSVSLWRVAWD